jgi:hypothetical protein
MYTSGVQQLLKSKEEKDSNKQTNKQTKHKDTNLYLKYMNILSTSGNWQSMD